MSMILNSIKLGIFINFYGVKKLFFLLFILPGVLISQDINKMPDRRVESWNGVVLELKINKKLDLELEQQLRFRSKNGFYDRALTQFKLDYDLLKWLRLGYSYRYINMNDRDGLISEIENHKRNAYYLSFRFIKLKRFYILGRIQYQSRRQLLSNTNKHIGEHLMYLRQKTDIGYNIKDWKLDPKLSFEWFSPIPARGQPQGQNYKYRFSLSTKYKLKGPQELNFKYMFEGEAKSWNPELVHIFDVNYTYIIKYKTQRYILRNKAENDKLDDKNN